MSPKLYKKKITNEVMKQYRKTPALLINSINMEVKEIMTLLGINNKINSLSGKQAFLII